ncbi:MAG: hypothetical protein ACXWV0_10430 [Flavisolibacter sp.]
MIYVLFDDQLSLSDLEKKEQANGTRERLKPVQEAFPDADMTAIWDKDGLMHLQSSNPQVMDYARQHIYSNRLPDLFL